MNLGEIGLKSGDLGEYEDRKNGDSGKGRKKVKSDDFWENGAGQVGILGKQNVENGRFRKNEVEKNHQFGENKANKTIVRGSEELQRADFEENRWKTPICGQRQENFGVNSGLWGFPRSRFAEADTGGCDPDLWAC